MFVVPIYVRDPHVHGVAQLVRVRRARLGAVWRVDALAHALLRHDDRAIAEDELGTMIRDAQPHPEAEGVAEPVTRRAHILVAEHGDDRRCWRGAIHHHPDLLKWGVAKSSHARLPEDSSLTFGLPLGTTILANLPHNSMRRANFAADSGSGESSTRATAALRRAKSGWRSRARSRCQKR